MTPIRKRMIASTACLLMGVMLSACDGSRASADGNQQPIVTSLHRNIATTFFQAGAPAGPDDQGISNRSSAWYSNWAHHICGIDRDGSRALVQTGCDNLFYAALPCADFNEHGPIKAHIRFTKNWPRLSTVSPFKNQWIMVSHGEKTVYVQWEDVGPLYEDDCKYVFGEERPHQERTGEVASALDLSPAAFKELTGGDLSVGVIMTNWQFVDAGDVPSGPWKKNTTTSDPDW